MLEVTYGPGLAGGSYTRWVYMGVTVLECLPVTWRCRGCDSKVRGTDWQNRETCEQDRTRTMEMHAVGQLGHSLASTLCA